MLEATPSLARRFPCCLNWQQGSTHHIKMIFFCLGEILPKVFLCESLRKNCGSMASLLWAAIEIISLLF